MTLSTITYRHQTCPCSLKKLGSIFSSMKSLYLSLYMIVQVLVHLHTHNTYIHGAHICTHFNKCRLSRITFPGVYFWLRSSRSRGQPRCVVSAQYLKMNLIDYLYTCTALVSCCLEINSFLKVYIQRYSLLLNLCCTSCCF